MEVSDKLLISKIKCGENEAFDLLYSKYQERICRYLKRFVITVEAIEDVSQNTFLKVYQNIQNFDEERQFSSWLYRIAHNEAVNWLKKNGGERQMFSLESNDDFEQDNLKHMECPKSKPDEQYMLNERSIELNNAMCRLTPDFKKAIELYYIQGLTYKEVALTLNKPVNTIGTLLNRARKELESTIRV